jgi:uncharacterized protein (TIGR00251 family)
LGKDSGKGCLINVRVSPRASRDAVSRTEGGVLKVRLTAPPVEGKANRALKRFLAKRLGVPQTHVEIVSGVRARVKTIRIEGLSSGEVSRLLREEG